MSTRQTYLANKIQDHATQRVLGEARNIDGDSPNLCQGVRIRGRKADGTRHMTEVASRDLVNAEDDTNKHQGDEE